MAAHTLEGLPDGLGSRGAPYRAASTLRELGADPGPRARERGWGEGMGSFEDDSTQAGGCQALRVGDPN